MLERFYFYPCIFQSSPSFTVTGEATLMILISQGAWIPTEILPLQLLLNIHSPSLVPLFHSLSSLSHFLFPHTPSSATILIFSSIIGSLFLSCCPPTPASLFVQYFWYLSASVKKYFFRYFLLSVVCRCCCLV